MPNNAGAAVAGVVVVVVVAALPAKQDLKRTMV